ncbi:MAG: hypothetical protein ACYC2G_02520 [Gemmatimonadaceae bacterium]
MKPPLEPVVVQELDALDYDLVELHRGGSRERPVLEVRIERRDGAPITVSDCTRASRAIEARLEADQLVSERYVLQLSSPGVERPVRTAAEWRRFAGKLASVNSPALGGRIEAEIVRLEGDEGSEVVVLNHPKQGELRVALADVTDARLAFRWNPKAED